MKVLNVGGGSRTLPEEFYGWHQDLLDIDPSVSPDICCSAVDLFHLPPKTYDAINCSHNLEHVYRHEVPRVLIGFRHVLKDDGFAKIDVPNLGTAMEGAIKHGLEAIWYYGANGVPITYHDVIYGWSIQVGLGNEFYAHKTGFTETSLFNALLMAGFQDVQMATDGLNLSVRARKCR